MFKYSNFYYPDIDINDLKLRIENRVDEMFKEGLIKEVEYVLSLGYNSKNSIALQGIGYKEVLRYLNNEITLDNCKELIKLSHIKYAKRQITWFEGEGRGYILNKVSFK